ncbi:hypothetical protein MMC29_007584 [Sticta canariensis]|nr:hypothetical protein [Sticta canariensis]
MPSDDLKNYALSDTDFYTLLGITLETSQRDIDRAWRRTALKYHPDKVGNDPVAKEKFHLAQIGYDLLSNPVVKALYDSTRNARLQRERKNELLKGRRKTMADDLFARERGVKRGRDEENDEEKLEREIRRLAEDGKRRRKEREDALREDIQQKVERNGVGEKEFEQNNAAAPTNQTSVSEIDRTVRIRWPQEGQAAETSPVGQDQIMQLFSHFGKIESADFLSPKLLKSGKNKKQSNKKQLMMTCMVLYASVVGAHAAVEDFPKQKSSEWQRFDSVFWATNKEPDFITAQDRPAAEVGNGNSDSAPSTPMRNKAPGGAYSANSFLNQGGNNSSRPSTPLPASWKRARDGEPGLLGKKPSFASFSSAAAFSTPPSSGKNGFGGFVNSPSLEEMTMIRLKNAEKKRLADEIRRQDEEAAEKEEAKQMT